jgi:hypothetical protein
METFVGDSIMLILDTGIDISGYTSFIMKYKRPDGVTGIWIGEIHPTNIKALQYYTLSQDLNVSGEWAIQAHVELGNVALHGKWANFTVYNPLSEPHQYVMESKAGKFSTNDPLTQMTET